MEIELPQIDQEKINSLKTKYYFEVIKDEDVKVFIEENKLSEAFVYENVSCFKSFIKSKNICRNCQGLNNCPSKGIFSKLSLNLLGASIKLVQCKEKKELENLKDKFLFLQSKEEYFYLSFKELFNNSDKYRKSYIKKILEKNKKNQLNKGIYLFGEDGIGKTCIMTAWAREISRNHTDNFISYIDAKAMIPVLVDDYFNNKNSFDEDIELLSHCKFLFIDNFGQEEKTKTGKIEVLYKIINNRYERKLPTFFISRYSLQQIRAMYGTNINDSATNSIINKINETCDIILLDSMKYPY